MIGFFICLGLSSLMVGAETKITIRPDHDSGVYAPNEVVTWTIAGTIDREKLTALPYTITRDAAEVVASGLVDLSAGPVQVSATRNDPGCMLVELKSMAKDKPLPIAMGGAVIAPDKIGAVRAEPGDFSDFWQAKCAELALIPSRAQLEKMPLTTIKNADGMELFHLSMDNIGHAKVHALFAKPSRVGKYPALLVLNAAGVGRLDQAMMVNYARSGWLVLNVSAHDLPVDETPDFFQNLKDHDLKNYFSIGNEARETSYFLRMILGCLRGADYLSMHPEWDGKNLVVTGISQGGLQSLAVAALCPKISTVLVDVPAGCDVYGPVAHPPRAVSWPYWLAPYAMKGHDAAKVEAAAGYFDPIYFAARIHSPTLIAVALVDVAARPAGVIAAFNAVPGPKKLLILPMSDHYGSGGTQGDYFTLVEKSRMALQRGTQLPFLPAE